MESIVGSVAESPEELLLLSVVFLTTYLLYRRIGESDTGHKLPPALPSLPVVGSLLYLPTKMEDLAEFCMRQKNKLGNVFSLRFGPK